MFVIKVKNQYVKFSGRKYRMVDSIEEATKLQTESISKVTVSRLISNNCQDVSYCQVNV